MEQFGRPAQPPRPCRRSPPARPDPPDPCPRRLGRRPSPRSFGPRQLAVAIRRGGSINAAAIQDHVHCRSETAWTVSPQLLIWRSTRPLVRVDAGDGKLLAEGVQVQQLLQFRHQSAGRRLDFEQDLLGGVQVAWIQDLGDFHPTVRPRRSRLVGQLDHRLGRLGRDRHGAGQVQELQAHLDARDLVHAGVLGLDVDVGQDRFFPAGLVGGPGLTSLGLNVIARTSKNSPRASRMFISSSSRRPCSSPIR